MIESQFLPSSQTSRRKEVEKVAREGKEVEKVARRGKK
jgi:hypothetical protein